RLRSYTAGPDVGSQRRDVGDRPGTKMLKRRDFLRVGLAGLGVVASGCRRGSRQLFAPRSSRPRYVVQVLLSGGHDTLYTTDPKRPGEVDAGVTLPRENPIVEVGEIRL